MVPIVKEHCSFLEVLCDLRTHPQIKDNIIVLGPDSLIVCLCAIALNTINGAVPLHPLELDQLKQHKSWIYQLASTTQHIQDKRCHLQTATTILPLLLKPTLRGVLSGDILYNDQRQENDAVFPCKS